MQADRVIALRTVPAGVADASRRVRHNTIVADVVRRVPGVQSLAFIDVPLLQRAVRGSRFRPPMSVPHPAGTNTDATITPEYFETMGMVLRTGRGLTAEDRGRGGVINESLARRYWRDRNPVGEFIRYDDGAREIVGVVSDIRDFSLDYPSLPTLYYVWDEANPPIATIVVRFAGSGPR